jgi:hypothetical protein
MLVGAICRVPVLGPRLDRLRRYERFCPLDSYYSPMVAESDLRERGGSMFDTGASEIVGIDLNVRGQLSRLAAFGEAWRNHPYPEHQTPERRFWLDNPFYKRMDAMALFGMLNAARPNRLIEVGSGFTSALMLDARDTVLGGRPEMLFIEPHTERLESLLRPDDRRTVEIRREPVQRTPLSVFDRLESGDVLLIDSSHVSKMGSDVNFLFFEVIPRLRAGVFIHVHDVFWPFIYPRPWIEQGRHWNEAFLLRALLIGNKGLAIEFVTNYLMVKHADEVRARVPGADRGLAEYDSGSSIWLRRA